MMFIFRIFSFLFFLKWNTSYADLKKLSLESKGQEISMTSQAQSKLKFVNYKKFKIYKLGLRMTSQEFLNLSYQDDGSTTSVKINKNTLTTFVDNLSGEILLNDQKNLNSHKFKYDFQLDNSDLGLKVNRCDEYNLEIKLNKKMPNNSLVAISCDKINEKIILSISTLGTLDINSSSLAEYDGKGETWRAYDLGALKAEQTTVLDLKLSKESQEFAIRVRSKSVDSNKKNDEESEKQLFYGGLLYSMNKIKLLNSYSDASPGLFLGFLSKPLFYNTKIEAEFKQGFAAEDPKAINTSDLKIGLLKGFSLSNNKFAIVPRISFVNSKFSQELSKLDINLVSFGAGLGFDYNFSKRERLQFVYQLTSFGSKVVSSASSLEIKMNFILFTQYNLIIGLEMQKLTGTSQNNNAITVDQNTILIGLGFD